MGRLDGLLDGENEFECCARGAGGLHDDFTTVIAHDLVNHGQSKPRALLFAKGHKRLKDVLENGFGNSAAMLASGLR